MVRLCLELFFVERYSGVWLAPAEPDSVMLPVASGAVGLRAVAPEVVDPAIA
jgi:hypothetical protein